MKICGLGAFGHRKGRPGQDWDSHCRAWETLGHDTMLVNIRRWSTHKDFLRDVEYYEDLRDRVLAFEPDLLWMALKDGLSFLIRFVEDVGRRDFRAVLWFRDLRVPEGVDSPVPVKPPTIDPKQAWGLIDYLFLSSGGKLLQQYQRAYKVPRVCFMPHTVVPEIMCPQDVPQKRDIVFTGGMDELLWHRGRTRLIKRMSTRYSVEARSNIFRKLAEFYSSSKIVFGADVVGEDPAFNPMYYTSNRIWLAMACGSCYVCQWFPGIDRLARNHEHLVWWKDEQELYEVLDYYLAHDEERERIGYNARALILDKHTHIKRMQNIFDFMEGKVDDFQGFLDD